jgi:SAM-dependent methyltransferase
MPVEAMPALDYRQVADLYDIFVQTDIDVDFFLQEARGCRKALELTAGTGRLSLPLLKAGVPLACLDNSPDMLAVLRRKLQSQGLRAPIYEMDLCSFALPESFDLLLVPFNAFAELTRPEDQRAALGTMRAHLAADGRLIVTLHNPPARLKIVDEQLHWRGQWALPDGSGQLLLWSLERYDDQTRLVTGLQFFEIYGLDGLMQSRRLVDLRFCLHSRQAFAALVGEAGYRVIALFGDYDRTPFDAETSPYMIWILGCE